MLFKVIDACFPSNWQLTSRQLRDDIEFSIVPKEWANYSLFYENLDDDDPKAIEIFKSIQKRLGIKIDKKIIKTNKLGKLLSGEYKNYFIKIYDDSVDNGGYLLTLYKTLPQKESNLDEWFSNYDEIKEYFINNNFQTEWLED